jgi:hypothetical protein
MSDLPEANLAPTWDSPAFQSGILKKGERRPTEKPATVAPAETSKQPMICTNCGKPYSIRISPHCQCLMWDIGKTKQTTK